MIPVTIPSSWYGSIVTPPPPPAYSGTFNDPLTKVDGPDVPEPVTIPPPEEATHEPTPLASDVRT